MRLEYAKLSVLGDRAENQDRAAVMVADQAAMMLVFDGMGGHADGALAAETGIRVVEDLFRAAELPVFDPQGFLYSALSRAHDAVVELGLPMAMDFRPRATCAVCLIQESGAWWAHIGDSRIYHVRDGRVLSRSRDHSHVEVLIEEGTITEEEARDHPLRNFVESCVGGDTPVPDMSITSMIRLLSDDVLLVCTDGLWSGLSDETLATIAAPGEDNLGDNLKDLSLRALQANSPYSDNTTGTAVRWLGD